MSINNDVKSSDRIWNSKKLIELSENLGAAYNPGMDNERYQQKTDSWNANKLIQMSRHLGSAYGVDF